MGILKYEQALQRLAAYCSRSEHCTQDLRRKMTEWGLPESDQERALHYLKKENFLNEARFCQAFANDKAQFNHWGPCKIRYELQQRQIPDTLIRQTLANLDPQTTKQQLHHLLSTKRQTIKGKNPYETNQKLLRFAISKGFPIDDIRDALQIDD
jgi:regulatory protein